MQKLEADELAEPQLGPEVLAIIASMKHEAEVVKEKYDQAIKDRSSMDEAFELERQAHRELVEAWEKTKLEFKAAQDAMTAEIAECDAEIAEIAEEIRRIKKTAAECKPKNADVDSDLEEGEIWGPPQ